MLTNYCFFPGQLSMNAAVEVSENILGPIDRRLPEHGTKILKEALPLVKRVSRMRRISTDDRKFPFGYLHF
jgi:hypothetical protein